MLAQYWRILVLTAAAPVAAIAEIELRATAAGVDLTGSGTASSSGDYSSSFRPSNAFDNNLSNAWACPSGQAFESWISYDFGTPVEVLEAVLTARGTAPAQAPTSFVIGSSTDGISWVDLIRYQDQAWTSGESKTFAVPATPGESNAVIYTAGVQRLYKPDPPPALIYTAGVQVMRNIVPPVAAPRRRHVAMLF